MEPYLLELILFMTLVLRWLEKMVIKKLLATLKETKHIGDKKDSKMYMDPYNRLTTGIAQIRRIAAT